MTAFHIKLLALITMIIDHIGLFFFPQFFMFRIFGRLSFPLFAWLIANGAYHTHNHRNYFIRLVIFALISQIPFSMASQLIGIQSGLNIFFTLSIGLGAILLMHRLKQNIHKGIVLLLAAAMASYLQTDYGAFGVLCIAAFYLTFKNPKYMIISQIILFVTHAILSLYPLNIIGISEIFGLLSLLFIYLYNGKEGPKMQYLFYLIYPLQYVIYYLLLMKR